MHIVFDSNPNNVSEKATNYLVEALQVNREKPVLLLLSGGSEFDLLKSFDESVLHSQITIGVLDERWSDDAEVNNFMQLMGTDFYKKAQTAGCEFIDTRSFGDSQQVVASRFEKALHHWKFNNPNGEVIITQGVGADGHTSGIMPYPEDEDFFMQTFQSDKWVVGYNAGDKNPYPLRVTTTITFLIEVVDISIFYVAGKNKKQAFYDLQIQGSIAETPARVINKMKDVIIFTDQS